MQCKEKFSLFPFSFYFFFFCAQHASIRFNPILIASNPVDDLHNYVQRVLAGEMLCDLRNILFYLSIGQSMWKGNVDIYWFEYKTCISLFLFIKSCCIRTLYIYILTVRLRIRRVSLARNWICFLMQQHLMLLSLSNLICVIGFFLFSFSFETLPNFYLTCMWVVALLVVSSSSCGLSLLYT